MQTKQEVVNALNEITGGLSQTAKMPESSFSIPAIHCKEKRTVRKFLDEGGIIPDNIVIQMSGYMLDGGIVKGFDDCKQITHHLVHTDRQSAQGYVCPVEDGKGVTSCEQANCYACWDRNVNVVTSGLH